MTTRRVPLLLWPFWALWRLIVLILSLSLRLVAVVLGVGLIVAGALISLTIVGALIGVPLIILGFMLIWRGIF